MTEPVAERILLSPGSQARTMDEDEPLVLMISAKSGDMGDKTTSKPHEKSKLDGRFELVHSFEN